MTREESGPEEAIVVPKGAKRCPDCKLVRVAEVFPKGSSICETCIGTRETVKSPVPGARKGRPVKGKVRSQKRDVDIIHDRFHQLAVKFDINVDTIAEIIFDWESSPKDEHDFIVKYLKDCFKVE